MAWVIVRKSHKMLNAHEHKRSSMKSSVFPPKQKFLQKNSNCALALIDYSNFWFAVCRLTLIVHILIYKPFLRYQLQRIRPCSLKILMPYAVYSESLVPRCSSVHEYNMIHYDNMKHVAAAVKGMISFISASMSEKFGFNINYELYSALPRIVIKISPVYMHLHPPTSLNVCSQVRSETQANSRFTGRVGDNCGCSIGAIIYQMCNCTMSHAHTWGGN